MVQQGFSWERFVLFCFTSSYDESLQECFQIIHVSYTMRAAWKVKSLQMCLDVPDNAGLGLLWDSLGGTQVELQWVRQGLGKTWNNLSIESLDFYHCRLKKNPRENKKQITHSAPPKKNPPSPKKLKNSNKTLSRCYAYQKAAKMPFLVVLASWFPSPSLRNLPGKG